MVNYSVFHRAIRVAEKLAVQLPYLVIEPHLKCTRSHRHERSLTACRLPSDEIYSVLNPHAVKKRKAQSEPSN